MYVETLINQTMSSITVACLDGIYFDNSKECIYVRKLLVISF